MPRTRRPLLFKGNEQYVLDFGQEDVNPIRCKTCGMLYNPGEESDEKQHAKFHAESDKGIKWSIKSERPKKYFDDGSRVVVITKDDQKPVLETANKILKFSQSDITTENLSRPNSLFLVHITSSNHAVGYIFVEKINEAYNLVDLDSRQTESEPVPAGCGIMNLWVHPSHRHQKIATRLLDVARANVTDDIISRSRIAVCEPTDEILYFLKAYLLGKRPVKVYFNSP